MIEWFEDLEAGTRFKGGQVQVTEADIKRFAAEFDPQPFNLDNAAAERTAFKGLAASGWHTAAIAMRLTVEVHPFGPHPLLGLGVDNLRWLAPVRPGDTLRIEGEVVGMTPSRTKPQGTVLIKWTLYNQRNEAVYTFTPIGIMPRRPALSPRPTHRSAACGPSRGAPARAGPRDGKASPHRRSDRRTSCRAATRPCSTPAAPTSPAGPRC